MPSSVVWKIMKVAVCPVRNCFNRLSSITISATHPFGRQRMKPTRPTLTSSIFSRSPAGSNTPIGATTRKSVDFCSATFTTMIVRPTSGRSSATTLWTSAHWFSSVPGRLSQRTCQSPCADFTSPCAAASGVPTQTAINRTALGASERKRGKIFSPDEIIPLPV